MSLGLVTRGILGGDGGRTVYEVIGGAEIEGDVSVPAIEGDVEIAAITADISCGGVTVGSIPDFKPGTTLAFTVTCKIDGTAQNITADTVTFRMKSRKDDTDAQAIIEKAADVITNGASGQADFVLSSVDTDVALGNYYADVEWATSGGSNYVIVDQEISVVERVSDS